MKSKYTFHSPSLQKIDNEAEPIISKHKQSLDHISNDIKALEEKLQQAAIHFNFIYLLEKDEKRFEQMVSGGYFHKFMEYTERALVWGKTGDNDGFRLCYNVYVTNQEILSYFDERDWIEKMGELGEPRLVSSKPLIESKSYIRLSVEKELPIFYQKIIDELKNTPKETVYDHSPNHTCPSNSKVHPKPEYIFFDDPIPF